MAMNLRKKGYPRQNIKPKASGGQVAWAAGMFFLLFLAIFLRVFLQLEVYRTTALYLEDALAASNLASAVIDVEEYGISHKVLVKNPEEAYERYRWAVKGNLNLDDAWKGQEGSIVQGQVRIVNYTLYNVGDNEITVYHYDENGLLSEWQELPGGAVAPNGIVIEATSVYSEIVFMVKGFLGTEVEAHKGNLADIVH